MFIVLKKKIADQMKPYEIFYVVKMKLFPEALASANPDVYVSSKQFITMSTNFSFGRAYWCFYQLF